MRFVSAIALGQELLQAPAEARLPKALKAWDRFDLVILDELGYLGRGPGERLLFQFCAQLRACQSADHDQFRVFTLDGGVWRCNPDRRAA